MGWIRRVRCEKLQCDFVARTFVLIEPVQYVLQQVSCSYERIPNAPIGLNGTNRAVTTCRLPLQFVDFYFTIDKNAYEIFKL